MLGRDQKNARKLEEKDEGKGRRRMSEPKKCDAKWDKNDAVSDSDRKRMSEDECGSVCARVVTVVTVVYHHRHRI